MINLKNYKSKYNIVIATTYNPDLSQGVQYGFGTVRLEVNEPIEPGFYNISVLGQRISTLQEVYVRDKYHPAWKKISIVDPDGPFGPPGGDTWGELPLFGSVEITDGSYWVDIRELGSSQPGGGQYAQFGIDTLYLQPTDNPQPEELETYYLFPSEESRSVHSEDTDNYQVIHGAEVGAGAAVGTITPNGLYPYNVAYLKSDMTSENALAAVRITFPKLNSLAHVTMPMFASGNLGQSGSLYMRDAENTDWTYVETYGFTSPYWNAWADYDFGIVDLSKDYWVEIHELDSSQYAYLMTDRITIEQVAPAPTADFDDSGDVDVYDLATFISQWLDQETWY